MFGQGCQPAQPLPIGPRKEAIKFVALECSYVPASCPLTGS
jgi:hypothetical protein